MAKKVLKKEKISLENIPVTQEVPLIDRGKELPSEISEKKPVRGRKIAQKSNQTKESQLEASTQNNPDHVIAPSTKSRKKNNTSAPKNADSPSVVPSSGETKPNNERALDSSSEKISHNSRKKKSSVKSNVSLPKKDSSIRDEKNENISQNESMSVIVSNGKNNVTAVSPHHKSKKINRVTEVKEYSDSKKSVDQEIRTPNELSFNSQSNDTVLTDGEVPTVNRNNLRKSRKGKYRNEVPTEINGQKTKNERPQHHGDKQLKSAASSTKDATSSDDKPDKRIDEKTQSESNIASDNSKEKRKRKKKKNKRDASLPRTNDNSQAKIDATKKVEVHKQGQHKHQIRDQKQSTQEKKKTDSHKVVRGGKHTIAALENPERKPVVLRHPSKKTEKKKGQQNTSIPVSKIETVQKQEAQTIDEHTSRDTQKDVQAKPVLKAQKIETTNTKKTEQKNLVTDKSESQDTKELKVSENVKKKQKKETKKSLSQDTGNIEKTQTEAVTDEDLPNLEIATQGEKKPSYDTNKSYNLIPLPKPETLKRKHTFKHKIPLPLKIGSYDELSESIVQKLEHYLTVELHIPKGSSLLLAVSGGVDSIVMTDLFCVIAHRLHYDVQLCHINHKLRGKESDEDERSVKGFAKRCGLRIHTAHVHVQEYAKKNRISIETAARILRYNALDKQARSCGAEYVVTAHTADDAAETFLMNLFRGSGVTGLSGIPSERPLSKKINVIRPLLSLRKDEIISYAQTRGLYWREDSSNSSLLFTRNKVRLQLLPHLREIFGVGVVETLNRTASLMQGVDEVMNELLSVFLPQYVQQVESGSYTISLLGLRTQTDFLKGEIFQAVLVHKLNQQNQSMSTIKRITQLLDADVNTIIDVNGQIIALRDRDAIILSKRKKQFDYYSGITLGGEIVEQEWILRLSVVHKQPKEWSQNPLVEYFDADLLPKLLTIRSWRDGDKFQPIGMNGHTSVSDFLTNNKTRALDRKKILVLCAGSEIVWIIGKRMSDKFKVSNTTREFIRAEFIVRSQSDTTDKNDKE